MKAKLEKFTGDDTNYIKGIAIILLLIHHLFYSVNPAIVTLINIHGKPLYPLIAGYSKVCVAIFTILSGYGLFETTSKDFSLKNFYFKRYTKLYLNYWVVFLIFVPIGMIFFNFAAQVNAVYQSNIKLLLRDIFGISYLWGGLGVNPTWWYISAIIVLYLIFPFIKVLMDKFGILVLIMGLGTLFLAVSIKYVHTKFNPYASVSWLIFPFVLGMYLSKANLPARIKGLNEGKKYMIAVKLATYGLLFLLFAYQRRYGKYLTGVLIDGFFGFLIIMIMYELSGVFKFLYKPLIFLGKHSMNIFMFHTFIFGYFLTTFIYSFKYPVLILAELLSLCVVLSIGIEKLKDIAGVNKLYKWITAPRAAKVSAQA